VEESAAANPELERILEAEREARAMVDAARAEAARIEEEARRLGAERIDAAHAACAARREDAHALTVERAEPEVARIRAEGRERCHDLVAAARRREEAALAAAEAALLGES
jgi:vacuolar-type H+-ATPase subunit H